MTPSPDLDATLKAHLDVNSLPKITTERQNLANLSYFDPHLDRSHGEGKIVLVDKDVNYRNVILFVQRLQSLVTFKGAAFVKANVGTSLQGSALEWYSFELSNFNRNALNNISRVKSWVNTFFHHFKVPTNIALGLLINEIFSLSDTRTQRPPAQYVCTILQHSIGYNIVNIVNQQSFVYRSLASELNVFVSLVIKSTKASDFIRTLEKKQEVWYKMLIMPVTSGRHYKNFCQPSLFGPLFAKPSFPSQSDTFLYHQTQQTFRASPQYSPQQSWRASKQPLDVNTNGLQC